MMSVSFHALLQSAEVETIKGNGKFYYSNDATYEGDWLLIPDKTAETEADTGEGVEGQTTADGEEGDSEEKADEDGEEDAEPSGIYLRHGKGKYVEGEYSYDGDWENVSLVKLY